MPRIPRPCVLATLLPAFTAAAAAQCATEWLPTAGVAPGAESSVLAITEWDPDGAGPLGPRVVFGGTFTNAAGIPANRVVAWDPATDTWSALGSGFDDAVYALAARDDGALFAGGLFTASGANAVASVARWDGTAWQPLGTGIPSAGFGLTVRTIQVLPNGDLFAGGVFTTAGGVPADNVARWDGTGWSAMGIGIPSLGVYSSALAANGDLLAGIHNGVRRWNGTTWSPVGSGWPGATFAVLERGNGDVVAGGLFGVATTNGGAWTQLGAGFGGGYPLGVSIYAFEELPNGDLVTGGAFVTNGAQTVHNIARWQGTAWQPFGSGTDNFVYALRFGAAGELLVGGRFAVAGGVVTSRIARLTTTCPAAVADLGGGCPGSGGGNELTAVTLPWVDGVLRTRGTGLPSPAIVLADTGLVPIVPGLPLHGIFPQAPVGCDLGLVPIVEQLHVSTAGAIDAALLLPNTPPLVGVTFYQQLVAVELGAGLDIEAITVSNVLELTAGQF